MAARVGIREGDVLLRYGGKALTGADHFRSLRANERAGGPSRKLELLRRGTILTVELPPGDTGLTLLNKVGPLAAGP